MGRPSFTRRGVEGGFFGFGTTASRRAIAFGRPARTAGRSAGREKDLCTSTEETTDELKDGWGRDGGSGGFTGGHGRGVHGAAQCSGARRGVEVGSDGPNSAERAPPVCVRVSH